jgi:hypothetical protein
MPDMTAPASPADPTPLAKHARITVALTPGIRACPT